MGLKVELDWEAADQLIAAILKDTYETTLTQIKDSASKLSKGDHHRVDLEDNHRLLFAIKEVYNYYTGEKL